MNYLLNKILKHNLTVFIFVISAKNDEIKFISVSKNTNPIEFKIKSVDKQDPYNKKAIVIFTCLNKTTIVNHKHDNC